MEWLRERVQAIPVRLAFESALELMSTTQIGTFQVAFPPAMLAAALRSWRRASCYGTFLALRNSETC